MDVSINTRPLLGRSDTDSDFDEDPEPVIDTEVVDPGCSFKDTHPLFNTFIPADRYNIGYAIFYILGTTILLPWFFFITAEGYWMYKFREIKNDTLTLPDGNITELQASFTSYMTIAATVPSTVFLIINPVLNQKISLNKRMYGSLVTMLLLFIATTVFTKINTDSWQYGFYVLILGIVVVLNIASSILQSALFGIAGKFPTKYISAAVTGQSLGGIVAACAQIVSLTVGASAVSSAFVYFIMADIFIFLAILAYMFLASTIFFKHYNKEVPRIGSIQYEPVIEDIKAESAPRDIVYGVILKKISVYGMSLWYCFVVMFSVYPAITVLVKSMKEGNGSQWNDVYFVPVVTFLTYSVCDYSGRMFAGYVQWPEKKSWIIATMSVARTVFIPIIMLCNALPRHHLPVLINSDWSYIAVIIAFGLSNGYLANINFINVPKIVEPHEQEVAGAMLVAFLGVGIACGSAISIIFVKLL